MENINKKNSSLRNERVSEIKSSNYARLSKDRKMKGFVNISENF